MAKLIVFPSGSHNLCLPVFNCIGRASMLDWSLSCYKYSHIGWDHNIFTVNVLWGRWFYSFAFKQKQHIMPMDQVFGPSKVIEQKSFCFFRSYTQAYLSLAGFSNMLLLKISLRGFSMNVFAPLAGPVITRFLVLSLPWISKSLILVTNWKVSIPLGRRTALEHYKHWPKQP